MPAKTVVFSNLRKHDGNDFRNLLPGEYTQMAGRAGRRGLDSFGYVVINCKNDEVPDEGTIRQIVTGKPTRLESRFRLTYNMILNLLRQEGTIFVLSAPILSLNTSLLFVLYSDMKVEDMIKRSFSEWATQKEEPEKKRFLRAGESRLKSLERVDCKHHSQEELDEYFEYVTLLSFYSSNSCGCRLSPLCVV
jgi:antiviral helicase SKI2